MCKPILQITRPRLSFLRINSFSCLLLLSLSLLTGTLAAQTSHEATFTEAKKLIDVGTQLLQAGSNDSLEQALQKFEQAQRLFHSIDDGSDEAATLLFIALTHDRLAQNQKALDSYNQALALFRDAGDKNSEALTLDHIGLVYSSAGYKEQALGYYLQAFQIYRTAGNVDGQATALNNLGLVYLSLGETQRALDYCVQALTLFQTLSGASKKVASVLNSIGSIDSSMGEKQKALDSHLVALRLSESAGDVDGEATALNEIGLVYDDLGEREKALDYLERALSIDHKLRNSKNEARTLVSLGSLYNSWGKKEKARDYYQQAMTIFRANDDRQDEAVTHNNIGFLYEDAGENQKALESYTQAQKLLRSVGDRPGEGGVYNNIGSLYEVSGEKQKAFDCYTQALSLFRATGHQEREAATLFNLAHLKRGSENLKDALTDIEASLDIIESLRTKVIRQELRSSYLARSHDYYEFYIDLLMRLHKQQPLQGFESAAVEASEHARARSLLDLLHDAKADIRNGVDPELLMRERSLQQLLNDKAGFRGRLLSGSHTSEQAAAAAREIEALTSEYQEVEGKIRQTSPRYSNLNDPVTLSTKEVQSQLDRETLLMEYSLGAEHSYLWLISPTTIKSYDLPSRKEIETAAFNYYERLSGDDSRPVETAEVAKRLSRILLAPVASQLGEKRLVIVADGALQYLPFAALPDPNSPKRSSENAEPLIIRHEIVGVPSISVLASLRSEHTQRKPAPKDIVVLADPVFSADDRRLGNVGLNKRSDEAKPETVAALAGRQASQESGALREGTQLVRLPETRKEADKIVALVPASRSKEVLDFAASRDLVESGELQKYRYITFATHGLLDSVHPELTAVVLSLFDKNGNPQNGYLRVHDIYNLSLSADLVVLSGCQTALGKDVKGEGLIGLTRGFMYAGSPRVVASLWSVRDDSTAALMVKFYRGIIKEHKRPAEALRAAQIEMRKNNQWRAPHYWASFVLQGEWR